MRKKEKLFIQFFFSGTLLFTVAVAAAGVVVVALHRTCFHFYQQTKTKQPKKKRLTLPHKHPATNEYILFDKCAMNPLK